MEQWRCLCRWDDPSRPLLLRPEESEQLRSVAASRTLPHGLVRRARIILLSASGMSNQAIAARLHLNSVTVSYWRRRFLQQGLPGLHGELRPGRPRSISDERVAALIRKTLQARPADATHWSCRSLAAQTRLSKTTVHRIWRAFGLQPHRQRHLQLSSDPFFVEKVRDIVGLYLHPPDKAVVLCVDEKSQIQALERTQPLLPHGKQWLGAFQGLDLALFIDAQHHGFVRRMQIQSHDIPHFFNEEGIGGELKVTLPMRLETKCAPDAVDRGLREARLGSQRTATPVRGVGGSRPQRLANQRRDSFVADRARATRAQLTVQPRQALLEKTPPPIAHGHGVEMKPGSNGLVAHSRSTQQNDPRPPYQTVREGARDRDGAELLAFLRAQQQGRLGSSHRHRHLHCSIEGAHTGMSKARLTLVIYGTHH